MVSQISSLNQIHEIAHYLSQDSFLPLFLYRSFNNSPEYIEDMFKLYFINQSLLPQFKTFQSRKDYIEKLYTNTIKKFSLSDSDLEVLDRITEALFRPHHDIEAEMIVRIAELEIKGVEASSLEMLEPLYVYWSEKISPIIGSFRSELALPNCQNDKNTEVSNNIEALGFYPNGDLDL